MNAYIFPNTPKWAHIHSQLNKKRFIITCMTHIFALLPVHIASQILQMQRLTFFSMLRHSFSHKFCVCVSHSLSYSHMQKNYRPCIKYTHAPERTGPHNKAGIRTSLNHSDQHRRWQSRLHTRSSLALQLTVEPLKWNSITTASPAMIHQHQHNATYEQPVYKPVHVCTRVFIETEGLMWHFRKYKIPESTAL